MHTGCLALHIAMNLSLVCSKCADLGVLKYKDVCVVIYSIYVMFFYVELFVLLRDFSDSKLTEFPNITNATGLEEL